MEGFLEVDDSLYLWYQTSTI